MKNFLIFIFTLLLFPKIQAQPEKKAPLEPSVFEAINTLEDTLGVLGFLMVNDSLAENRFASCKKFIPTLVSALKEKNSFQYPFDRLKTISILYPPDSTFRIFSWQLYVDKDTYHQYGAIQMNESDLKLFRLLDRPSFRSSIEQEALSADEWIGAVYYNIHQFETPEGPQYLLFGFDGNSFFSKRKLMDVLKFENGKPIFGSPVFVKYEENKPPVTKHRLILEYSAETAIRLNYDEHLGVVIFDHLIQQASPFPGQEFTWLPDGSYEAYKLEGGKWMHVDKVYDHQYDEAPRPEPVFKNENKKDLFGKKKNRQP